MNLVDIETILLDQNVKDYLKLYKRDPDQNPSAKGFLGCILLHTVMKNAEADGVRFVLNLSAINQWLLEDDVHHSYIDKIEKLTMTASEPCEIKVSIIHKPSGRSTCLYAGPPENFELKNYTVAHYYKNCNIEIKTDANISLNLTIVCNTLQNAPRKQQLERFYDHRFNLGEKSYTMNEILQNMGLV